MKKINVLLVVLMVVFVATFAGCKKTSAVEPGTSEPVVSSEEVSETPSSEEVSEPASEETSEPESSEIEEEMDLTPYSKDNGKNFLDLANDMRHDEVKIIVWGDGRAKEILSDGDSYNVQEGENLLLYYPQNMKEVKCNLLDNELSFIKKYADNLEAIVFHSSNENVEVTFDAVGEDGTTYKFTVFLTNN